MRRVINKLITEEDLYGAVDAAFSQGCLAKLGAARRAEIATWCATVQQTTPP